MSLMIPMLQQGGDASTSPGGRRAFESPFGGFTNSRTCLEASTMRFYLTLTAIVFGLLTVVHIWRMAVESASLARDPFFLLITVISAAVCVWAVRLIVVDRRRTPWAGVMRSTVLLIVAVATTGRAQAPVLREPNDTRHS